MFKKAVSKKTRILKKLSKNELKDVKGGGKVHGSLSIVTK